MPPNELPAEARLRRARPTPRAIAVLIVSRNRPLSLFWQNDQSISISTFETLVSGVRDLKKNEAAKTETTKASLRSSQSPFRFLSYTAGILRAVRVPMVFAGPALLLLASPFSGTDTPVCALLLSGNPSELSFHTASHLANAREETEAHLTTIKFLIANPELEFNLSPIKTIRYKFLIANK